METFGRYELIKKIATGGMAEIFLARQAGIEGFEKLLVLKRILPHLAESEEFVEMFLHEARVAVRLNHPNIVQIYDLGEEGGSYFIAMEYIHGEDARRIWRSCEKAGMTLPIPLACRIAIDAAAGLYYAHNKTDAAGNPLNIIHRDISPQNLLISFEGAVKVVDFGIAKAADQATQTKSGVLKGKYSYMSPEQASGLEIDQRTDQFALGIVLYELLTFQRLFKRSNEIQTLTAVAECDVKPPSTINPNIPPELDAIVMKALSKEREDRFKDLQEFQLALEEWLMSTRQPSSSALLSNFLKSLYADRLAQEALQAAREELPFERDLSTGGSVISQRIQRRRASIIASAPKGAILSSDGRDRREARSLLSPNAPQSLIPTEVPDEISSRSSTSSVSSRSGSTSGSRSRPGRRRNTSDFQASPQRRKSERSKPSPAPAETNETSRRKNRFIGAFLGTVVGIFIVVGAFIGYTTSGIDFMALLPSNPFSLPPPPTIPSVGTQTGDKPEGTPAPATPSDDTKKKNPNDGDQLIKLTIETTPPGATVHFNGLMLSGTTPLTQMVPRIMKASIRVTLPGFQERTEEVLLGANAEQKFAFQLTRLQAVPLTPTKPPRDRDGGETKRPQTSTASTHKTTPASTTSESTPSSEGSGGAKNPAAPAVGSVHVDSIPVSRVWEGTTELCSKTPCDFTLPVGRHRIVLSNPEEGFSTARVFTLKSGQSLSFEVQMAKGQLLVIAKPWADVWLRNKKLGTTPMPKVSLYEGRYNLTLINADLNKKKTVVVDIIPNDLTKVVVDMTDSSSD